LRVGIIYKRSRVSRGGIHDNITRTPREHLAPIPDADGCLKIRIIIRTSPPPDEHASNWRSHEIH
jgi:hypothetical protein